jgi:hypothetical protein
MREGGKGSALAIEHKVYLDFVSVANPPYEYESRLKPMYPRAFQHLHLMVMDPYDVALTKLKRDKTFSNSPRKFPSTSTCSRNVITKNFATTSLGELKTTTSSSIAGKKPSLKIARGIELSKTGPSLNRALILCT